jgi:DNA helicase-2/ATP-dependent DNA helicase PcrA
MEEGLFPHSRTLNNPAEMEEERRLCYVGMTRAMDALIVTRARYRRRYGNDLPEASMPSRFLEEIPSHLLEDLSSGGRASFGEGYGRRGRDDFDSSPHYRYEDEDQSARPQSGYSRRSASGGSQSPPRERSLDNIAQFFGSRQGKAGRQESYGKLSLGVPAASGARGFTNGQRVRHPKYGEGIVSRREGEGDDAKITVQFREFGMKKLVEKFAHLERV